MKISVTTSITNRVRCDDAVRGTKQHPVGDIAQRGPQDAGGEKDQRRLRGRKRGGRGEQPGDPGSHRPGLHQPQQVLPRRQRRGAGERAADRGK
ncbi:hypothetical protein STA1M1_34100 [Sinisalibacter aestuarii]|uniref:Uncharacterized protein n=1 Tax=Sinisalibacter aestuarii TaxID=2949426 RepID=A0ABQ5LYR2_9RHOB|nr:hypothetical protein STA1M1_34100 [Sinisalibacter aestuarii]